MAARREDKNNATKIDNMMVRQEEALKTKRKTRSEQNEMSKIRNATESERRQQREKQQKNASLRRRNV